MLALFSNSNFVLKNLQNSGCPQKGVVREKALKYIRNYTLIIELLDCGLEGVM